MMMEVSNAGYFGDKNVGACLSSTEGSNAVLLCAVIVLGTANRKIRVSAVWPSVAVRINVGSKTAS